MAKQPTTKGGTSRIRFIMLEAEIPEGDLSQITAAIQNALKPTTTIVQRLPSQAPASLSHDAHHPHDVEIELEGELADDTDGERDATAPKAPRDVRPRKPTVPKVLELDLTTPVSFEAFANEHPSKNDTERNLVVLAWFKEHRPDEAVTANHVYTCYRAMKWPSGIEDFSATLRALKKQQFVTSPGRAQYALNHLGFARVEKMASA